MFNKRSYYFAILFLSFALMFSSGATGFALNTPADKAEVPLTNPGKPALLKVSMIFGSITVTGYNGKTILVEAHTVAHEDETEEEEDDNKKAKGMYRIKNTSSGLNIVEENNEVLVKVTSFNKKVTLNIKVPFKTNLNLKSINDGFIKVNGVEGDLEVGHTNGPLNLTKVSGTVVANTINGDVDISFEKVNLAKPMAITSFNGDVTVTLPASAKFDLKMKSQQGDIYSDFKLNMTAPKTSEQATKKGGKYRISFDKFMYGQLNGGGEELKLKTFNGDIYIKKKK